MNSNNFFNWIRRSQIVRSDRRWIGGVCAGLAERLGWDVALIRVLTIILIVTGAGLFVYPLAWILLPNSRNVIIAEELVHGHADGEGIAAIIVLAIGAVSTVFTFWGIATVALFFVLIAYAVNQAEGRTNGNPWNGNPWSGNPGSAQAFQSAQTQPSNVNTNGGQAFNASPINPAYTSQNYVPQNPAPAPAQSRTNAPYANNSYASPTRAYSAPVQYMEQERIIHTRKSAGPVLRLLMWGGIFLSAALTYLLGISMHITSHDYLGWGRMWMLWGTGVTIAICIITLVLAVMGRKTAGYAWLGACGVVICLFIGSIAHFAAIPTRTYEGANGSQSYRVAYRYEVKDGENIRLTKNLVKQLNEGTLFVNSDKFHTAHVTLDLTNWESVMGKHTWTKSDGTTQESSCPAGDFNVNVSSVDLVIKVKKGCAANRGAQVRHFGIFYGDDDAVNSITRELNHKYANKLRDEMRKKQSELKRDSDSDADDKVFDFLSGNSRYDDDDWGDVYEEFGNAFDDANSELEDEYNEELKQRLDKDIELHINTFLPFGTITIQEA
ncbi:PspC domain-containing protein [Alloscardovia theropitheci]|uniref:PspC domain-containing protein n=1 Tax=Alloscardovia theropitheci TaxID=2496842 RepID=A0A4R0QTH4_9BIFI|nr:PspC domain-containing protein [Alloscardovia theropitheci]TCD54575.1 PspC domain-containing protein [Alloscardovia theropitheci]